MASHSRRNSRGSFSVFSLDAIRSLSRVGNRQAFRPRDEDDQPFRSQSSLSCDPHQQLVSPEPASADKASTDKLPTDKLITPKWSRGLLHGSNTSDIPRSAEELSGIAPKTASGEDTGKPTQSRPLSWLNFHRGGRIRSYGRSNSMQLPEDRSTSTVARSIISAPILRSTTNSSVAKVEGVQCRELSTLDFAQPPQHPQLGWVPRCPQSPDAPLPNINAEILGSKINATTKEVGEPADNSRSRTNSTSSAKEKLARFRDNLSSKVRGSRCSDKNDSSLKKEQFSQLKDGRRTSPTVEQRIGHRRMETLNLCVDKIRSLTGHGQRRKNVQQKSETLLSVREKDQEQLLGDDVTEVGKAELSDRGSDFGFGSLTRSFASAVDKLDFQSTLNSHKRSFLRSKTSLPDTKALADDRDQPTQPGLVPNWPAPPLTAEISAIARYEPPIYKSMIEPCIFSAEQASLVSQPDRISAKHPRGVNPLRCHPDVMEFAEPPTGVMVDSPLKKGTTNPRLEISNEDDEDDLLDDLEDAPIFSPSLGDLSQYSRLTPSSATNSSQNHTPMGPGDLYQKTCAIQYDTPTRPPGKGVENHPQKLLLKKSRSNLGLFQKSQSEKIMPTATEQERSKHRQVIGHYWGAPLTYRDENQKIEVRKKEVKKSQSMAFGAFANRKSASPETSSPPSRVAHQPPIPSPLRQANMAKYPGNPTATDAMENLQRAPFRSDRSPTFVALGGKGDGKEVKDFI